MARFIQPEKAREIAYSWHGGQWSPLYAFASSGLIENLQALIAEVRECEPLAKTKRDADNIRALLRFLQSSNIRKTPSTKYPYAAPWSK